MSMAAITRRRMPKRGVSSTRKASLMVLLLSLLLVFNNVALSNAFTTNPITRYPRLGTSGSPFLTASSGRHCDGHQMSGDSLVARRAVGGSGSDDSNSKADTGGLKRGAILMLVVLTLNVWLFSIPTEFRRARFCEEEQVRMFPDSKCITFADWTSGIVEYYRAGGGIHFDFSIEEEQ